MDSRPAPAAAASRRADEAGYHRLMPLGWHVSVFRQADGSRPGSADEEPGERIAVWQTGIGGLDWLAALASSGDAIDLGGNGYPRRFTVRASTALPRILSGPPDARAVWFHDPGDVITERWEGRTVLDRGAAARCYGEEWLLVVAWDES